MAIIKILLADDDEKFAMMIEGALVQAGFSVVRALDGEAALASVKIEKPDLVLLDIMMPKKIGFEVLEEMKADRGLRSIPVITLSHLAQPSDILKSKRLGALEHLIKTEFSIRELLDKVSRYAARK